MWRRWQWRWWWWFRCDTAHPSGKANTGLTAPTLLLDQDIDSANPLVQQLTLAYGQADDAQAVKALGSLGPSVGTTVPTPFNCASGNITFAQDPSGNLDYTYNNCFDGTYTFNGPAQVRRTVAGGVVTSYQLSFTDLQVTGSPGLPPAMSGMVTCTPAATAGQAPSCTTSVGDYLWGYDIGYAGNGSASGTHQCTCQQGTWNVTFDDFSAAGGEANVFATNGSAIVTRAGAKTFTVMMFVGSDAQSYSVTLN